MRLPAGLGDRPTVPEVRSALARAGVTGRSRRALAAALFRRLRTRGKRMGAPDRWRSAAALLALEPESRPLVTRIFRPSADPHLAEARFTACAVLGVEAESGRVDGVRWVLPLVVRCIERARSDPGYSTFACGCLLGMEWPAKEAVPILRRLARQARFPAGRAAARHGLEHLPGGTWGTGAARRSYSRRTASGSGRRR